MILQPPKKSPVSSTTNDGLMSSDDKIKLNNSNIAYGTCSTAAATAAKVVSISGNTKWTLTAGSIIAVKFTNTNTASNPTLNVNGTGAKSIVYDTKVITLSYPTIAGYANRYILYLYDGTNYVFIGWSVDIDTNTTYSNASLGQGYGTCATEEATTEKAVTLSSYALSTGGVVAVKFTYAVPASATMNINSKGAKAIYYRGAAITAGVIKAGDTATFVYNGSQYHLLTIDRDDDTTYNEMTGATSSAAGSSGLVPAPAAGDQEKFLRGDGTWGEVSGGGSGGSSGDSLPLSGGVVTGNVQQSGATTDYTTYKFRNIGFGTTTTPTSNSTYGGSGSIYFQY